MAARSHKLWLPAPNTKTALAPWVHFGRSHFLEAFGRAPEEGRGGGSQGGAGRRHMRLGGERGSWWKGEDTNCGCFLGEAIF